MSDSLKASLMHASTSTHARTMAAWHAPTSWTVTNGFPIPVNIHVFKGKFLFLLSASLLSLLFLFQQKNLGLKLEFIILLYCIFYYPRVFCLFVFVCLVVVFFLNQTAMFWSQQGWSPNSPSSSLVLRTDNGSQATWTWAENALIQMFPRSSRCDCTMDGAHAWISEPHLNNCRTPDACKKFPSFLMAFWGGGGDRWQTPLPFSSSIGISSPIPAAVGAWERWEKITGHLHIINPTAHLLL